MTKKQIKKFLQIKKALEESNIDPSNFMYCPEVPMLGIEKSYVIEEFMGVKIAKLISPHKIRWIYTISND